MAIAWPSTLPAPSRSGLKIVPASNVLVRTPQSGRTELRRFGGGAHDVLTGTLRLLEQHPEHGDQVEIFERWHRVNLNLGGNWIDAPWLADTLGYADHYLRIAGYLQRSGRAGIYSEYQLTMHIKAQANTWPDIVWPVWTP